MNLYGVFILGNSINYRLFFTSLLAYGVSVRTCTHVCMSVL